MRRFEERVFVNMSTAVRCTPFCSPCEKGYKHHELLTALLNTSLNTNTNWNTCDENEHGQLAKVVKKYEASGWDKNSAIMDKNEEFRFPMLHWACVLGKPRTVRWLLENGFNPTVQCRYTKETAVHRSLITLPDFIARNSSGLNLFSEILPSLKQCLGVGDQRQDNPLHVAANFIVRNQCSNLYENLLVKMVSEVQTMPEKQQNTILNALNSTGNTLLHILAANNKSCYIIKVLINAGTDSLLVNKLGISPLDVAIQHGAGRIVTLLKRALVEGCKKSTPSGPINGGAQNEEVKIRRSERRSNNLITFNQLYEAENSSPESMVTEAETLEEQNDYATSEGTRKVDTSTLRQKESWHDVVQNKRPLPTAQHEEAELPTVTSSSNIVMVKEETLAENICQCLEECATHMAIGEEDDLRTIEPSARDDSEVPFLHVMKEAGVLPNLKDIIAKTKEDHMSRMKVLEKSLKETDEGLGENGDKEKTIRQDIDLKRKELERLACQLDKLTKEMDDMGKKRKLLEEERGDLRKKLQCCETLLKTVPKDSPY